MKPALDLGSIYLVKIFQKWVFFAPVALYLEVQC